MGYLRKYVGFGTVIILALAVYTCSDTATGPEPDPLPEFNSKAAPGDSAHAFLSDKQFSRLHLEIDYMPGHEPTGQALDSLKLFLQNRLNKSTIHFESPSEIPSGGQTAYSINDVTDLEDQHRDHYTSFNAAGTDTLWAYFIITDGEYTDQNVLGIAYYNTSMVFFGQTIQDNSGGATQPPQYKLEGTVFQHEMGHNMGLVANGSPMQQQHRDQDQGKHCDVEECLMYYAVETTEVASNLVGSSIPDLDPQCINDLQANGGK